MTEEEAQAWVIARWGEAAANTLGQFVAMVVEENRHQNLVSASSIPEMWVRHIVDSAQLLTLAEDRTGLWIDVGTGGGFPGMVAAILRSDETMLVEPRRRRADFLTATVAALTINNTTVRAARVERVGRPARVVSARAVASPAKLFAAARTVTSPDTLFLLPNGREAEHALTETQRHWRGVFHVEQSVTNPDSRIIVAYGVEPR